MKILGLQIGPGVKCAFVVAALLTAVVSYFFPDTIWNLKSSTLLLVLGLIVFVFAGVVTIAYIDKQNFKCSRLVNYGIIGCTLVSVGGVLLFAAGMFIIKAYTVTVSVMNGLPVDKYNTFIPGGVLGVIGFYLVALLATICLVKHVILPICSEETRVKKIAISTVSAWIFATLFVFLSGTLIVETHSKANPAFRRDVIVKNIEMKERDLAEAKSKLEEFDVSRTAE
jgi:hypothetical protein